MVEKVHHIDFVVRDLDAAAARFTTILGIAPRSREKLLNRGIELVRFEVGDLWIILVQPVREDSPVGAFLDRHGEGFFHIAYLVADVEAEAERLRGENIRLADKLPRRGVEGWKLVDLEMAETFGVYTQLVEDNQLVDDDGD